MKTHHALRTLLALVVLGCGEPTPPATGPARASALAMAVVESPDPAAIAQAAATGTLARSVLRDPTHAEALLSAAGLTPDAFEARLYDIAADGPRTDAYRSALEAP